MATTTQSAALVPIVPVFTNSERLALAGFLAGYAGLTREAYELDLRQYAGWCQQHHVRLFQVRRADITAGLSAGAALRPRSSPPDFAALGPDHERAERPPPPHPPGAATSRLGPCRPCWPAS